MSDEQKLQHYEALRAYADALEAERDELRTALRGLMQWVEENTREAERLMGHWPSNWRDLQALAEGAGE